MWFIFDDLSTLQCQVSRDYLKSEVEKKSELKEKTQGKHYALGKILLRGKNSKLEEKTSKSKQKPLNTLAKTKKRLN